MRAPWPVLVLLSCSLGLTACGSSAGLRRGELVPPVQARPPRSDLYVQARQAGFVLGNALFGWRSKGTGFTLDVHNRTSAPVALGLSRAVLDGVELGGPARFTAAAVTSGAGGLPPKFDDRRPAIDVTVPPGGTQTLWVVFAEREELDPWRPDGRRFRASLVIPTSSGANVVVPIDDARDAPHLERWPLHTGMSVLASTSLFGSGKAPEGERQYVLSPLGWGIWHLQGPFMFRFGWSWIDVLETIGDRAANDTATGFSLATAWIPRGSWFGLDAGAGVMFVHGDNTTWGGRSPMFTANLGVVWALGRIQAVPFSLRLGYQHNFSAPGDRHGTYFAVDVPMVLF
jgi:hypothetical protein